MSNNGFDEEYWNDIYAQPKIMDGVFNARIHADYLHALFALDGIEIDSILDVGFGLGYLLGAVLDRFKPRHAVGLEPSLHAFDRGQKRLNAPSKTQLKLLPIDASAWCLQSTKPRCFDLGICTSVFQYLSDMQIEEILPVLAERVKFLYFTVPTDLEAARLSAQYSFVDSYARRRTRKRYNNMLAPYFTVVGNRLLESKNYFDENNSLFTELVFRH